MVFLEANAYGIPVVAGRSGGVGEAVVDEVTGYLVDPLDVDAAAGRVAMLLQDSELRARLGRQGQTRVAHDFQWSDRAAKLAELLLLRGLRAYRGGRSDTECRPESVEGPSSRRARDPSTRLGMTSRMSDRYGPIAVGPRDDKQDISIILPVYNHARELPACIESLRHQTLPPKEIIIVDDGSTDESFAVAQAECTRGGPWRHCEVIHQANAGAAAARNVGFARSRGGFVLFSDADIEWKPDAFEKLTAVFAAHPEASYAYSSFHFGWKRFACGPFDSNRLKRLNFIHTSALIRREHFPGFDPGLK
jgi:hypothetical protein